jgi:amino acid adenylation domain-containing protein
VTTAGAQLGEAAGRAGQFPLSHGQERLWLVHQLDPDDPANNLNAVRRLRGPLNAGALARALTDTAARHEVLRTRFPEIDGYPVAVVEDPAQPRMELIDLGDTPPGEREEQARRLVAQRTNAPLDLAAPPLRVTVIRLADDDHVLCIVVHHIIADGWSINVLLDDLAQAYRARAEGGAPQLPPLPVRYRDFAGDQRGREPSPATLSYWADQLAGAPALAVPTDRPRPAVRSSAGDEVVFQVEGEVAQALAGLARAARCTLFTVLLAAYQVLLGRFSGQDDVVVGAPAARRDRVELEPLIGLFASMLVLRGDLSGDPAFTELLRRTKRAMFAAMAHQDVPLEQLFTALRIERDPSRTPLFQTMFALHTRGDGFGESWRFASLSADPFPHGWHRARYDLTLDAWPRPDGLHCALMFSTDLFDRGTAVRLATCYQELLASVTADPGARLSALTMLSAAQWRQLTQDWNHAASPRPARGSQEPGTPPGAALVPAMIAAAAAACPGAPAVLCGASVTSYAELDARASQVAAALRERGMSAGSVVGVCLGRTPDAVAALLGIWRAGGAYFPLDPAYPAARLAFLAADSGARLVVTSPEFAGLLPDEATAVIPGQAGGGAAAAPRPAGVLPAGLPDDGAYLIYTSGSAGQPKGVLVGHHSLASRVRWMREAYQIGPGDVVAQFASLSFDTHAEEIFPALAAGAALLMLPDGPAALPDVLRTPAGQRITVLDLPTAYWHHLVSVAGEIAWPAGLRLVILGGEQPQAAAVAQWRARFGDRVRLVNTYGPTEATIIATAAELGDDGGRRPPIGRPVAGSTAYVLGSRGELVPPGAPGELCLGGAGLARGYLGRPALTAQRFTPDPFGPAGSRLYRTGDRARWRPDGCLEFLGRLDDQVKVRGYRVEPGEVEAQLLADPAVRQAAVLARDERLVAYVVCGTVPSGTVPSANLAPPELRSRLAGTLPPYLVPDAWLMLNELPLTAHGKVDREALLALPLRDAASSVATAFAAPRTDAEALVASVLAAVLGLEPAGIGAFDDFFALGGHSLSAIRVIARLRAAAGVDIPIRTLFDGPSVAALAAATEQLLVAELAGMSEEEVAAELAAMEAQ